ncbi:Ref family recombination enhancement nuclease [Sphingomonas sp.]|jgi:hypothetical protein|uniref:Ref family recombination enhancement nuclease n=1 Tax=Sphingomonas sp. TaxID=28214 RepID=UPI003565737C
MSFGSKSLPPPTVAESRRIELCKQSGCIACRMEGKGEQCGYPEFNHIVDASKRAGHRFGYCLGAWHHRGVIQDSDIGKDCTAKYGPSLINGSKTFHARYGSDQAMQDYQDDILGFLHVTIKRERRAFKRSSKIVPRRGIV